MFRIIQIENRCGRLEVPETALRVAIHALDASGEFTTPDGELSIVFLEDNDITALHERYLDDCSPTDVITFPGDTAMHFAGEICLSVEQAYSYSQNHGMDFAAEIMLYIIHGYLHLAGLDDHEATDSSRMRAAEKKALSMLESSGKIPPFRYHS